MASDGASYLQEYSDYFEEFQKFVATLNYEDDLLPSNLKCRTGVEEVIGECVDWTLRYLRMTKCPQSLLSFLTKSALNRVNLKNEECPQEAVLAPNMVEIVNAVCLQYCGENNPALQTLPAPPTVPTPPISTCAIKNSRRRMENRHAIVEDLDTIFNVSTSHPTNYYGVFDGHSGVDAATYCSTHMHCFIAQSSNYPSDPAGALRDAFAKTESLFTEKCNQENINGGCTALCVLHRPIDRQLYAAWVGDSQAIVISRNKILRLVNPHKPERADERRRIENQGGIVVKYGVWRVNGQLAVSRAIGDVSYKPFVSGVPEITSITLDGSEDFLVLGCDGLWDSVKEVDVATTVYEQLHNEPGDVSGLSQSLVNLARVAGSQDNISVLVVVLRPVGLIGAGPEDQAPEVVAAYCRTMDILDAVDNASNPFLPSNGLRDDGLVFDASPSEEQGRLLHPKEEEDDEDDEDDLGPETDVDAVDDDADEVDDVLVSPASAPTSNPFLEKTSLEKHEVLALALGTGLGVADDDQPTSLEALDPLSSSQLLKGGAEVENVAESGEESEDEWNYYRVEPTEKESASAGPQESDVDMESQLNPNAAVFIPSSPTDSNHIEQPFNENLTQEEFFNKENVMSSSFIAHEPVSNNETSPIEALNGKADEVWLSSSPKKGGVPLDNVQVPPEDEFDREVSMRPGDLDIGNHVNGKNVENCQKNLEDVLGEAQEIVEKSNPFEAPGSPKAEPGFDEFLIPEKELEMSVNHFEDIPAGTNTTSIVEAASVDVVLERTEAAESLNSADLAEPLPTDESAEKLPSDEPAEELPSDEPVETLASEDLAKPEESFEFAEPEQPSAPAHPFEPADPIQLLESNKSVADADLLGEAEVFNGNLEETIPALKVHSPIVSGASDFNRDNLAGNVLEPSSFLDGLSACDTSAEPLNEGIVYSTSGLDNIMNAVSINPISPSLDQISAQSTPFEGEAFEFESKTGNPIEDSFAQPEEQDLLSNEIKREVFSPNDSETTNDFNEGFAVDNTNLESDTVGQADDCVETNADLEFSSENHNYPETSQFSTLPDESSAQGTSPMDEPFSLSAVPQEKPVDEVSIIRSAAAFTESELETLEDFEPQYQGQLPQIPVPQARGDPFTLDFANAAPTVPDLCNIPVEEVTPPQFEATLDPGFVPEVLSAGLDQSEQEQPEAKLGSVPETALDHVNGLAEENAPGPDVLCVSPSPVIEPAVEVVPTIDLHAEQPPTKSETVPDVVELVPELASTVVSEEPAVSESAGESSLPQDALSAAAAVGVAAVAATSAALAATAVASKTDKKPASKAPAAKPKPSAVTKAPAKTAAKPAPPTSATAPKKPVVPPVPAARAAPRTTLAPKPKPSDATSKPASTASKPAPPKPRTSAPVPKLAAEKKPLTNGDASKPASAKPAVRTTTRPATAPARTTLKPAAPSATSAPKPASAPVPKTTVQPPIRRPTSAVASKPKPAAPGSPTTEAKAKPASTVSAAPRPRPATASTLSSRPATSAKAPLAPKPIDKQTKETTNKLISATRTTVSKTTGTTASKTVPKTTTSTASNKPFQSKPVPIRKPTTATGATKTAVAKKPSDKPKAPMTNGVVKNGHATPNEIPHQNGVSHDEQVIDKKESDFKIESLVDNQLVV